MAKITIAQLQTSDSYINELTATEMDATKGGLNSILGDGILRGGIDIARSGIDIARGGILSGDDSDAVDVSGNDISVTL